MAARKPATAYRSESRKDSRHASASESQAGEAEDAGDDTHRDGVAGVDDQEDRESCDEDEVTHVVHESKSRRVPTPTRTPKSAASPHQKPPPPPSGGSGSSRSMVFASLEKILNRDNKPASGISPEIQKAAARRVNALCSPMDAAKVKVSSQVII